MGEKINLVLKSLCGSGSKSLFHQLKVHLNIVRSMSALCLSQEGAILYNPPSDESANRSHEFLANSGLLHVTIDERMVIIPDSLSIYSNTPAHEAILDFSRVNIIHGTYVMCPG